MDMVAYSVPHYIRPGRNVNDCTGAFQSGPGRGDREVVPVGAKQLARHLGDHELHE